MSLSQIPSGCVEGRIVTGGGQRQCRRKWHLRDRDAIQLAVCAAARIKSLRLKQTFLDRRYDRTLGIETSTSPSNGFDKRWGDENSASRESSLLYIDRDGRVVDRTNFSAGLAVYAHGMEMIGRHPVLYGAVGGIPAVALQ